MVSLPPTILAAVIAGVVALVGFLLTHVFLLARWGGRINTVLEMHSREIEKVNLRLAEEFGKLGRAIDRLDQRQTELEIANAVTREMHRLLVEKRREERREGD
jgi:hypothetical protein